MPSTNPPNPMPKSSPGAFGASSAEGEASANRASWVGAAVRLATRAHYPVTATPYPPSAPSRRAGVPTHAAALCTELVATIVQPYAKSFASPRGRDHPTHLEHPRTEQGGQLGRVVIDERDLSRAPGQRGAQVFEELLPRFSAERIVRVHDRDIVGNRVVDDVAVDELDWAAQLGAGQFNISLRCLVQLVNHFDADHPLKAIVPRRLEKNAVFAGARVDEDVLLRYIGRHTGPPARVHTGAVLGAGAPRPSTRVCRRARLGSARTVDRLATGGAMTIHLIERIRHWIAGWTDDAPSWWRSYQ